MDDEGDDLQLRGVTPPSTHQKTCNGKHKNAQDKSIGRKISYIITTNQTQSHNIQTKKKQKCPETETMTNISMAYIVMAYILMVYILMAYILMVYILTVN